MYSILVQDAKSEEISPEGRFDAFDEVTFRCRKLDLVGFTLPAFRLNWTLLGCNFSDAALILMR